MVSDGSSGLSVFSPLPGHLQNAMGAGDSPAHMTDKMVQAGDMNDGRKPLYLAFTLAVYRPAKRDPHHPGHNADLPGNYSPRRWFSYAQAAWKRSQSVKAHRQLVSRHDFTEGRATIYSSQSDSRRTAEAISGRTPSVEPSLWHSEKTGKFVQEKLGSVHVGTDYVQAISSSRTTLQSNLKRLIGEAAAKKVVRSLRSGESIVVELGVPRDAEAEALIQADRQRRADIEKYKALAKKAGVSYSRYLEDADIKEPPKQPEGSLYWAFIAARIQDGNGSLSDSPDVEVKASKLLRSGQLEPIAA